MQSDAWKDIFRLAMKQLDQAKIHNDCWSFGGGTVLMLVFNHRISKDIDIFVRDRQFLSYISPRINDALEEKVIEFVEQENFTKLYLQNGEIDFIFSQQISKCKPVLKSIEGYNIYLDHPAEIISKKIQYRFDEFKTRDIFDVSVVYSKLKNILTTNLSFDEDKISSLKNRVIELDRSGVLEKELKCIARLPGAQHIHGQEMSLCCKFIEAMEKKLEKSQNKGLSL